MQSDFDPLIKIADKYGVARLGLMVNESWQTDPRRLVFTLSRYKFVAKMLRYQSSVVEVGCGDAFGSRIVAQAVTRLHLLEPDPVLHASAATADLARWNMHLHHHDLLEGPYSGYFDAAYAIDVLEHIDPQDEGKFMANFTAMIRPGGIGIIGMPSLESQPWASPQSAAGHVNCQSGPRLRATMNVWFEQVFSFSMNDEVVHTGFERMAHYLWAVCVNPRQEPPGG
jgi:hypothetical protein